jgi:sRNA-binding regulator protein Hfq
MVAEGSQRPVDDLEGLAQARFAPLSQAELKLLRAAPKGEVAFCGPSAKNDDPANDPAKADEWGPEREIRADLIRWLCVDRDAASAVDPRGIQIYAARITGALDLAFVSVPFPLRLRRCCLTGNANLISTDLPALDLAGGRVLSVTADGANVRGNVFLNNGFNSEGEVRLLGAQVGGNLECSGGTFKNPGENALSADRADVKGSVFLSRDFSAEGEVRLLGAQIGGELGCRGGTFENPDGKALSADRADVKGSVFLGDGFSAAGEVRLHGAQIGGSLTCSGGTFKNPGKGALSADRADVKGSVFLSDRFSAEGEVRLLGTQIGGEVGCRGGTFKNPDGRALNAGRADVKGSVFLSDGFRAEGEVQLTNAQIGGDLSCSDGKFSRLRVQRATIAGALLWRGVEATEATGLDLENASAGFLIDDEKSWPGKGKLFLDGFVYGHISGESPRDAKTRLGWLERQDPFTPKPYRQLAKVLRETGDDSGARRVLFEMECRRRQVQKRSWYARLGGWLLKWTIGYGFYPGRALGWLVLLSVLGWGLFRLGYLSGAMAPTDKDAYCFFRTQGRPPDYYQRFTASVYSLENSLPFVNLGQKDHWTPDPNPQGSWLMPGFLRWFRWGQVLLGWLLATLFVAGVTGVVRKE